jgi:antitoxin VapB
MAFKTIEIKNRKGFQTIRIPNHMKIDDNKGYLKKTGNVLYIIPFHNPWQNMMDSLEMFTHDFLEKRDHPANQTRELLD